MKNQGVHSKKQKIIFLGCENKLFEGFWCPRLGGSSFWVVGGRWLVGFFGGSVKFLLFLVFCFLTSCFISPGFLFWGEGFVASQELFSFLGVFSLKREPSDRPKPQSLQPKRYPLADGMSLQPP